MSNGRLSIRRVTLDDASTIAEQRVCMFEGMGRLNADDAATMRTLLTPTLRSMLASCEYVGWLAIAEDAAVGAAVVAGAGVQIRRLLPRPETLTEREALVVNVYVQPEYRRRGIARDLMLSILAWCRAQGIERVALHASVMGRPLYELLGFAPSNELVLYLK